MESVPIIFGPGLMCDEALFAPQMSHFANCREVRLADFTRQSTIDAMAGDILRRAPSRFCYAGLSMGGIVGLELYRQAPERIASLVLMNTTAEPDTAEKRAIRLLQIERARAGDLETMVLEELKPNYLAEQSRRDRAVMDEIIGMATRLGGQVFEQQSRALMSRADSRPTLNKIECPVTLVAGDQDILCPPTLHTAMAEAIEDASLFILPNCGHLSTMEMPAKVNQILEDVLKRTDAIEENA